MNDHEILLELLEAKKKYERQRKIELIVTAVVVALLIIVLAVAWVKVSGMMRDVQARLDKLDEATQEVQTFFDAVRDAGFDDPGETLKDLRGITEKLNQLFDIIGDNGLKNLEEGIEAIQEFRDMLDQFGSLGSLGALGGLFG